MTLAIRMLRNRVEAEEAVQDAFVRAFHALGAFEWRSSFSTWLYRIVFNVCATALGKKGAPPHLSLDRDNELSPAQLADPDPLPDVLFESAEFRDVVAEEIERLPPAYSGVVTLFFVQELSYDEIVGVTGMPLGTVKARLFRARAILRKAIQKRFQERLGTGGRKMPAVAIR